MRKHFGNFPSHEVFMLTTVPVHDSAKDLNITLDQDFKKYFVMNKLRGELSMVIIAHRFSTIWRADRMVVIDYGRVVEEGKWQELMGLPSSWLRSMMRSEMRQENNKGLTYDFH